MGKGISDRRTVSVGLTLIVLILFAPVSIRSVELSELTSEQRLQFNRTRLAVEVENQASFFVYQGTGGGGTTTNVRYFQGFDRIPEYRLFEVAGYAHEAETARRHHRTNAVLNLSGYGLLAVSIFGLARVLFIASEPLPDYGWQDPVYRAAFEDQTRRIENWLYVSLGTSIAALAPLLVAGLRGTHRYTAGQALNAADGYNRTLVDEIYNKNR